MTRVDLGYESKTHEVQNPREALERIVDVGNSVDGSSYCDANLRYPSILELLQHSDHLLNSMVPIGVETTTLFLRWPGIGDNLPAAEYQ
jgi:hypothetical protein